MKGERIRYRQTGEFHSLTFSCYHRRPYLSTVAAMELFEDALERVRLRYFFAVAGYVVMPEHVHLLVSEPQRALLSRAFSVCVRTPLAPLIGGVRVEVFRLRRCFGPLTEPGSFFGVGLRLPAAI
jgi:REP element-mobilizing transposase RayT